jgi:hypothetical protein
MKSGWFDGIDIENLTFQQQSFARQYNPDTLEQPDLGVTSLCRAKLA